MLTPRLNIAIAGCGIGGLALAALLAKQNHSVIIFDQFEQPEPVGSGLVIQPVGQAVLAATGALQQAQCFGNPINRLKGRTAPNNRRVLDVSYGKYQAGLAIHRASLFETLLSAAKSAGIKLCSNAQVIQSDLVEGGRNLQFKNRAMEGPFDLVVDATGAKSPLSPLINRKLPFGALWATVDWPHETKLPKNHLTQKYRAASIMAGVLPIGTLPNDTNPKAAIFWSLPNADFPAWRAAPLNEWKNAAQAHWLEFAPFLDQIRQHDDFTMATYSHGTLRIPIGNRLVHIGDAAHTASPQLGQGANMALLDAYALALAIEAQPLPAALETYRRARRNHTAVYQAASFLFTPLYQSDNKFVPFLRDHVLAPLTFIPPMPALLARLISGDIVPPIQGGLPAHE